jgi:protein-tyrosine phosphatase
MDVDTDSLHDSAYVSADSKRNSEVSLNAPSFLNMGRHESPAQFEGPFAIPDQRRSNLSRVDDRHPRLSMMQGKADMPAPGPATAHARADTVPAKLEPSSPAMLTPAQLKDLLETCGESEILLLDLRVSPQYALGRIKGALNLCIPTTLLKRATFNLQKLQQTFQADADQEKFARWQTTSHLIVYDAFSSEKRDAVSGMNMVKKFANEGYAGNAVILRGGFNTFAAAYPHLIDRNSLAESSNGLSLNADPNASSNATAPPRRPSVAPVVGGVVLPDSNNSPDPFFSNIRQNQDLVDGVGQMDVGVPSGLDARALPHWLGDAAERKDRGKKVSDKFLHIELTEQSRMKEAYASFKMKAKTPLGNTGNGDDNSGQAKVQLCGIEKGGKNRYKDILPFEHARVRLEGRPEGTCDYVNASHIKASRSHKRYIASQGPLPATFEVSSNSLPIYTSLFFFY